MAIAYDQFSTTTAATGNISRTHTPVGTPKGAIVWVVSNGGFADEVTTVTYGGTSMTEVSASPSLANLAEDSSVHCFFLGASVPTGAQTVAVTTNASAQTNRCYCVTVTADTDQTAVQNSIAFTDDATGANPSTTLTLGGVSCFVAQAFQTGQNSVTGFDRLGAGWIVRDEHDFNVQCAGLYTFSVGTDDVTVGVTQTADDLNLIAVAVKEYTPPTTFVRDIIQSSGFIAFAR